MTGFRKPELTISRLLDDGEDQVQTQGSIEMQMAGSVNSSDHFLLFTSSTKG